jgi:hypothetical protein
MLGMNQARIKARGKEVLISYQVKMMFENHCKERLKQGVVGALYNEKKDLVVDGQLTRLDSFLLPNIGGGNGDNWILRYWVATIFSHGCFG